MDEVAIFIDRHEEQQEVLLYFHRIFTEELESNC